jgi:hypothetical protein
MSDAKLARFLIAAPLVVAGALFALYGLFALTFREGGGRPTSRLRAISSTRISLAL